MRKYKNLRSGENKKDEKEKITLSLKERFDSAIKMMMGKKEKESDPTDNQANRKPRDGKLLWSIARIKVKNHLHAMNIANVVLNISLEVKRAKQEKEKEKMSLVLKK